MNITNKRLAFYIALIASAIVFALLILDVVTTAQAQLALVTIGAIAAPFGIADAIYDYLGLMVRIGEHAASLTPNTEDDAKVAEFKEVVASIRQRIETKTETEAVG